MTISRRGMLGTMLGALAAPSIAKAATKPNVLFISVDDLNDWVEPLGGYPGVVTPNFNRLANLGTSFTNAFAHVPACSPSRTSVFLGAAAYKSGIYSNNQIWSDSPLAVNDTLPGYLRSSGWQTFGSGKLFHAADLDLRVSDWSEYIMPQNWRQSYIDANNIISDVARRLFERVGFEVARYDFGPGNEGARADIDVTNWAIDKLMSAGEGEFIAAGLYRPHLPLVVPQEYFDLYPAEPELPPGFYDGSQVFEENSRDLDDISTRARKNIPKYLGSLLHDTGEYSSFLRAYLASISFADSQLGRLLDAVDLNSTYVVLWSDHGWQLGEKLAFTKFTLWERALHVPFMIAGPGIRPQRVDEPVSLLDIYPTLCGLLGLSIPEHCDGRDLSDIVRGGAPESQSVVSVWSNNKEGSEFRAFTSIRTADYRLIDYGERYQLELYDHRVDPYEFTNIAVDQRRIASRLRSQLPKQFAPPVAFRSRQD